MADDHKYYTRAGAHTVPARHFIVEAIRSKRNQSKPKLIHLFRLKPNHEQILQLGILALTDALAIKVNIQFSPIPESLKDIPDVFPIEITLINRDNPFFFDVSFFSGSDESFGNEITLKLEYYDLLLNKYEEETVIGVKNSTPPLFIGDTQHSKTLKAIESIEKALKESNSNTVYKTRYNVEAPIIIEDPFAYVADLLPDLLSEMSKDIVENPLIREFIIRSKKSIYNSNRNNDILEYYFEDHDNLRNKIRILENCKLVYNITYNNVDRFVITEHLLEKLTG